MMPTVTADGEIRGWLFIGGKTSSGLMWVGQSAASATGIFTGARATAIAAPALD
jgi:hypothetical protein